MHPDNPIVFPISQPKLYLTNVFDVTPKNNRVIHIPPFVYEQWDMFQNTCILFPNNKNFNHWEDLSPDKLIHIDNIENSCGYIATHLPSGKRCKFYNSRYKELLRLKTTKAQFLLQYLCLRRTHLLNDYLVQYPAQRKRFRLFKDLFKSFVENLHTGYMMKYVWKTPKLIHNKFTNYIDEIHREIFIPNIKNKQKITKQDVFDFLMKKHPGELLFILFSDKSETFYENNLKHNI
jgi:hypothetical protein